MQIQRGLVLLFIVAMVLAAGCASNKAIQIRSTPSGATVFVDGKQVGVTPLVLTTNDLMPGRAFDAKPSTQAMLVIEKAGYASYQLRLREFSLPDEVNAGLHPHVPATPTPPPPSDVVQEIERLQQLREKGAITEEEFQKLKRAVLEQAGSAPPP
ncbi:MAG: SHOCT domain-containing protein [Thermoanaerobaculia bacterium]